MKAQVKDAVEEKVWLRRSNWTLQSYCLLPRDIWQQLRLGFTLKHVRQENKRDLSLHISVGQDREHLLNKGWRQHQFPVEPKLGIAITKFVLPFILPANKT